MAGEAGKVKIFNCPNCGAGVMIRAQGRSLSVSCGSCGSIIDATNENYQILSRYQLQTKIKPLIALGARGALRGDTWEVIGFVIRRTGIYQWEEYLLYNPFKGFRWLTLYDGHWTFVIMTKDRPTASGSGYNYLGHHFSLFQSGDAVVDYVLGEFYWRVSVGEKVEYSDFIAPPQILSAEGTKDELVWSLGEYVEPDVIGQAFKLGENLPHKIGIGACQPFPHQEMIKSFLALGKIFAAILCVIHFMTHGIFWNLFVCLLLIYAPAVALVVYKNSFEQQRWGEESDVSGGKSSFFKGGDDE